MDSVSIAPILTPHGVLALVEANDASALDCDLAQRLSTAFARGSGHGLLELGAGEVGTVLPPAFSHWREFGARYVTALCTQPDAEALPRDAHAPRGHVPARKPPAGRLYGLVFGSLRDQKLR